MERFLSVSMHDDHYKGGYDDSGVYTLYVTYKCNWHCNYCSEDTWNRPRVNDLQEKIDRIVDNSEVSITGGEPGILPRDIMEDVITQLVDKKCEINVNTNGKFFVRFSHLDKYIDSYLYHCSEHLEDDEIVIPDANNDKIQYMLVITDDNMHRLEYYVNKYPDINFLVFGADNVIGKGLSRKNGIKISKEFRGRIDDDSHIHLITTCWEVNQMRDLRALR